MHFCSYPQRHLRRPPKLIHFSAKNSLNDYSRVLINVTKVLPMKGTCVSFQAIIDQIFPMRQQPKEDPRFHSEQRLVVFFQQSCVGWILTQCLELSQLFPQIQRAIFVAVI